MNENQTESGNVINVEDINGTKVLQKVFDIFESAGLPLPMSDRIVLEYGDYPHILGRRIIIDTDKVEIIDSTRI